MRDGLIHTEFVARAPFFGGLLIVALRSFPTVSSLSEKAPLDSWSVSFWDFLDNAERSLAFSAPDFEVVECQEVTWVLV
jgi:hypothetical protein